MKLEMEQKILKCLDPFKGIELVIVFGSVAVGTESKDSDLDIGVLLKKPIDSIFKMSLVDALAQETGRSIDLVDLREAGQPLLGHILSKGKRIMGNDSQYAQLMMKNVMDHADFLPYRQRILKERRYAWIET